MLLWSERAGSAVPARSDQSSIVNTITFMLKNTASPSRVIIHRDSPVSPEASVIEAANRQPKQQ